MKSLKNFESKKITGTFSEKAIFGGAESDLLDNLQLPLPQVGDVLESRDRRTTSTGVKDTTVYRRDGSVDYYTATGIFDGPRD